MSKNTEKYTPFDIVGDAEDTLQKIESSGKIPVGTLSFVVISTQQEMDDLETPFSTRGLAEITNVASIHAGIGASDQVAVPHIVAYLVKKHKDLFIKSLQALATELNETKE